jgi:hypothetical protein
MMRRTLAVFGIVCVVGFTEETVRAVNDGWHGRHVVEVGPWLTAVNLGPIVNSAFGDAGAAVSRDGLSLFFQSGRHAADADLDLFVSRRAAIDLPWEAPVPLGSAVNSAAPDLAPCLTADGHYLFFSSLRSGNYDIYVSHRSDIRDDLGWEAAVALPSPVNGPSFDAGPWLFEPVGGRPQLFFASERTQGGGQAGLDIYVTELGKDGVWTTPTLVNEVSSAFQDSRPSVRFDGLEMLFMSNRDGTPDVYAVHRRHLSEPWSMPERVELPINAASTDSQASFSANGRTMYFTSNRAGGMGSLDLYASTRAVRYARPHQ